MRRRVCCLVLALVVAALAFAHAAPGALAADAYTARYTDKAETLKTLGLFLGTDKGFELERAATRAEGAVMLVRLLGKEKQALSCEYDIPFTDVPSWARKYVGYMYYAGLTKGVSADRYGSDDALTYNQYITFVLRALGYSDSLGDFEYAGAYKKAVAIGLLTQAQAKSIMSSESILRDNIVLISYNALFECLKGDIFTLLDKLSGSDGAVSQDSLVKAALTDMYIRAYTLGISAENGRAFTASEISKILSPSVCYIEVLDRKGSAIASGSGFVISSGGYVATNYHVIEGGYAAIIEFTDGRSYTATTLAGYDSKRDLAVLKIDAQNLPAVKLGDSDAVENGQTVYAIGSPLGLENTISQGLVSNRARLLSGYDNQVYIQTSAASSAGSSGGVLVNENAEVIGITTLTVLDAQNINFAIPINALKQLSLESSVALSELAGGLWPSGATSLTADQLEEYVDGRECVYESADGEYSIGFVADLDIAADGYFYLFFYLEKASFSSMIDLIYDIDARQEFEDFFTEISLDTYDLFGANTLAYPVIYGYTSTYDPFWARNAIWQNTILYDATNGYYVVFFPLLRAGCAYGSALDARWYFEYY